jgi:adenylosuccinate lyase
MSHSSVERYNFPVATSTLAFMLIRFFYILSNLKINKDKMLNNLNLSKDKFTSQKLMLLLINKGLSRVDAYKIMQNISFKSIDSSELKKFLSEEEINNCFNLDSLIQYSKDILIGTNVK